MQIHKKENLFLIPVYFKFGSKAITNKHNWKRTKKREDERK